MNLKNNTKSIFYFIVIDILLLVLLILEDHFIGSHGRGRLEPNSPSSYEDILNNFHIFFIESLAITALAFWVNYKVKKSKK